MPFDVSTLHLLAITIFSFSVGKAEPEDAKDVMCDIEKGTIRALGLGQEPKLTSKAKFVGANF